jgi:transcription elongation factor Elf1
MKMKIKCPNCKHEWESKSKLGFVICASCGKKIKRKVENARK